MDVLLVTERSDSSRYFAAALPELRARGVDVGIVTVTPEGPLQAAIEANGIPTFALRARRGRDYPMAARRLHELIRDRLPKVVHAHEPIAAAVAGLAGAETLLYHRHHSLAQGAQRLMSYFAAKRAVVQLAVSRDSADGAIAQDRMAPERVLIAHNGVPEPRVVAREEIEEFRKGYGRGPIVLAVARLRQEKGLDVLIEATGICWPAATVVIVGSGPEHDRLRRLAAGNRAVVFAGPQEDVALFYASADLVVIPSRSEPFGLVAAEAMAMAKPVVASEVGGLKEIIIHRETGELVPPDNAVVLAAAMNRLLADSTLRARYGVAGRRRYSETFTNEAMVTRWLKAYSMTAAPTATGAK